VAAAPAPAAAVVAPRTGSLGVSGATGALAGALVGAALGEGLAGVIWAVRGGVRGGQAALVSFFALATLLAAGAIPAVLATALSASPRLRN